MKTLGERIEERRTSLGIGRTELARLSGLSHATIHLIETGKTSQMTSGSLVRIAAALRCTVEWLTGQPGPEIRVIHAQAGNSSFTSEGALILIRPLQEEKEVGRALPPLAIPSEWMTESGVDPSNARHVTAVAPALEGRVCPGDSVLIDVGEQQLADGRAYLLNFMGVQIIRRVFFSPSGVVLKAPDSSGIDLNVPNRQASQVKIVGRLFRVISKSGL